MINMKMCAHHRSHVIGPKTSFDHPVHEIGVKATKGLKIGAVFVVTRARINNNLFVTDFDAERVKRQSNSSGSGISKRT